MEGPDLVDVREGADVVKGGDLGGERGWGGQEGVRLKTSSGGEGGGGPGEVEVEEGEEGEQEKEELGLEGHFLVVGK